MEIKLHIEEWVRLTFFAVARSVLLVGRIEGEPDLRAVVQIKNNLAAFGHSKAFRLTETGFEWIVTMKSQQMRCLVELLQR